MDRLEHLLLDTASNLYVPELALSRAAVETDCPHLWSVTKLRLHGGLQDGVDLVQVENGRLGFTVVPTRGMALLDAECDGVRLGWDSPVPEPVHPKLINIERRGNLGWLDGFSLLF